MTEKRFTRNITGQIYDMENEKWYHEDYVGKPIEYEDEVVKLLNHLSNENKQLKTTIANLIEQNRKNNDLLTSDIRLLEKALWCKQCAIDIKRLKELRKEFEK